MPSTPRAPHSRARPPRLKASSSSTARWAGSSLVCQGQVGWSLWRSCRGAVCSWPFLLDRRDDALNVLGHRLGSAEIEFALVAFPDVSEAAVVGFPHEIIRHRAQQCTGDARAAAGPQDSDPQGHRPFFHAGLHHHHAGLARDSLGQDYALNLPQDHLEQCGSLGDMSTLQGACRRAGA